MKKRITRPDGTVEEIEGTSDEIAAYERALGAQPAKIDERPAERRVLNEQVARIARALEEMREEHARQGLNPWREIYRPLPHPAPPPAWPDWWNPNPRITWEVTDDSFTISDCRIDPSLKGS